MQRNRIVNSGADARLFQVIHHAFAVAGANHIEVIHRARPGRLIGKNEGFILSPEDGCIRLPARVAARSNSPDEAASRAEVRPESHPAARCSLPCRGSTSSPGHDRASILILPAISGIVRGHRPSLAARSKILSGIEAERSRPAHRSGLHPAIVFLGKVFGTMCLAGILDHDETVLFGQSSESGPCPPSVRRDAPARRPLLAVRCAG